MEIQERMADRHRQLAELDAQIEGLKKQSQESSCKRAALQDLRHKNNKLQTIVDLIKTTLTAPDPREANRSVAHFST